MKFGEKIRYRRRELGLTLEDVAKACNVNKATVGKWEQGVITRVKIDRVNTLAAVLHLNPVDLMILASDPNIEVEGPEIPIIPTKDERALLLAYRSAPENIHKSIDLLLAPYLPE